MSSTSPSARRQTTPDHVVAATHWAQLSELARLAPSPHNTQPYRLRPLDDDRADVVLLPDRLLVAEDEGNRYVYSALGIFAVAVERAAATIGSRARVTLETDPGVVTPSDAPRTVARVCLSPRPVDHDRDGQNSDGLAAAQLLATRRTSRLPYRPIPVDTSLRQRFVKLAESHGHRLHIDSDPDRVAALLAQNAEAIVDNLQVEEDRREIERWVRYGTTPEHGDGLWEVPLGQPGWQLRLGFRCPWVFELPIIKPLAIAGYLATMTGTQHVALLAGPFRDWPDLYAAGRLLMTLWLEMAASDVYMHPFGSTLTNRHHARRIAAAFGDDEGWLVFRFGASETPPASPRLATVVMP